METTTSAKTISQVFEKFLADRQRLAAGRGLECVALEARASIAVNGEGVRVRT